MRRNGETSCSHVRIETRIRGSARAIDKCGKPGNTRKSRRGVKTRPLEQQSCQKQ